MKIPIVISVLILAIGAALGWHDHQQLLLVRHTHEQLVAEAAQLGISADPAAASDSVRITKREREKETKEADAKQAAADFITFAREMEAFQAKGEAPDAAMQKRIMDFTDRMMSLDSSQLKILIAEMRSATGLKDETRQSLIGFSIMTLANDHPQAALALFTETSDLFKDGNRGKHVISSSLSRWAKDDPTAALEWVRKNGEKFPDLVTDDAKKGLISGAAINDPKLAFKLISELGLKDGSDAVSGIMSAAKTADERSASLAALREYLAAIPDETARDTASTNAASSLARGIVAEGFGPATKWLDNAKLSTTELVGFSNGLRNYVKTGETAPWIEWLGEKLPEDKRNEPISQLVRNWTQKDYQATGAWLNSTPDGPVKNAAIRSYAETISRYEPESAAQWATTLPPGKDRDETLKNIYMRWPKKDDASKAAAEAFKTVHGIK